MKFAKSLEREAVPEWRIKYLNYKAGKKYVKAISRAVARSNATPSLSGQLRAQTFFTPSTSGKTLVGARSSDRNGFSDRSGGLQSWDQSQTLTVTSPPIPVGPRRESDALKDLGDNLQYGSFVATPPESAPISDQRSNTRDFELPAPAMKVQTNSSQDDFGSVKFDPTTPKHGPVPDHLDPRRSMSLSVQQKVPTIPSSSATTRLPTQPSDLSSVSQQSHLRRLFSQATLPRYDRKGEPLVAQGQGPAFDLVREREREFFEFLDSELLKVEAFYKTKEEQAGQRLDALREQLHEMRNRRIQELAEARLHHNHNRVSQDASGGASPENGHGHDHKLNNWVNPLKAKIFPPGPNSKALESMNRTPAMGPVSSTRSGLGGVDGSRDYMRRPDHPDVSYRTAKRKLKLALQEFYRGLELLKSYALLNRTAFRKLNKKYDKAISARPPYRYLNEKVNQAWFVRSGVVDGHIQMVEDLYARYFERGNHKLAAGKLRRMNKKADDQSTATFQNGVLLGTGAVFAVQGLVQGARLLFDDDVELATNTSYLLQIYGGYFLMLYLFTLFCINCCIWNRTQVNYPFIFEFDQRHMLDWREVAQFPSLFFLLLGFFMWINFSRYGTPEFFLYYPVLLIFVTFVILFFPAPIWGHRSRKWLLYSHWRLLLAGLYPVEFRDFFLGDMYCSLTYSTANIELFFCLYARDFSMPSQCNSSHSRLLGFFTALPPIWRFLQCLRRYRDTSNVFPHLVNGGKYTATIIAAVLLSLFRFNGSETNLALFTTFSTINSVYCSIWDLFMDFSLIQPHARNFCLRDILALKRRWVYYLIMVIDPILRFSWILYAIFTHDSQHSTVVSFMVGFLEVSRRGMWCLLRVENEHCANVAQYKASRDVPLPYRLEPLLDRASSEGTVRPGDSSPAAPGGGGGGAATGTATGVDAAEQGGRHKAVGGFLRRNFSKILAEAHKQDFEKRRRPGEHTDGMVTEPDHSDDEDEDDADDAASLFEAGERENHFS